MNEKIVGIVAVIVIIAGGWYVLKKTPASAPVIDQTSNAATATLPSSSAVTVAYTDQGFSPSSVTIPVGTTVTFVNRSAGGMWVASAMHPTHIVYSGTSMSQHCPDTANTAFDECAASAPGSSFSFTFGKEGTWKYHDHVNASKFGTIIVTAAP